MPVFDFVCLGCSEKFTELIIGSEKIHCPKCKRTKLKKLFSGFNFISEATRLETNAKDLPSMEQWARAKAKKPAEKPNRNKKREKAKRMSMKDLKPRAAVHKRSIPLTG